MAQIKKMFSKKGQPAFRKAAEFPDGEAVALRAYEKFTARGGQHGSDLEDWYEAEKELKAKRS